MRDRAAHPRDVAIAHSGDLRIGMFGDFPQQVAHMDMVEIHADNSPTAHRKSSRGARRLRRVVADLLRPRWDLTDLGGAGERNLVLRPSRRLPGRSENREAIDAGCGILEQRRLFIGRAARRPGV